MSNGIRVQQKTILVANSTKSLNVEDKRITFELEGERSFYNFDMLIKTPRQFSDFVNDQIKAANETNHLLFVCLSNACELPKQDPYFSSMVTPLKNIYSFKVNAFEGVELIDTYATG